MTPRSRLVLPFAAGVASWSAAEYGLHRFAMHELRGRGLASREHLAHHADVTYFSPTSKKLLSAATTTAVAYPVAVAVTDRSRARAFVARAGSGIVYAPGVWHLPLVAMERPGRFLMMMWETGTERDCEERALVAPLTIVPDGHGMPALKVLSDPLPRP